MENVKKFFPPVRAGDSNTRRVKTDLHSSSRAAPSGDKATVTGKFRGKSSGNSSGSRGKDGKKPDELGHSNRIVREHKFLVENFTPRNASPEKTAKQKPGIGRTSPAKTAKQKHIPVRNAPPPPYESEYTLPKDPPPYESLANITNKKSSPKKNFQKAANKVIDVNRFLQPKIANKKPVVKLPLSPINILAGCQL